MDDHVTATPWIPRGEESWNAMKIFTKLHSWLKPKGPLSWYLNIKCHDDAAFEWRSNACKLDLYIFFKEHSVRN